MLMRATVHACLLVLFSIPALAQNTGPLLSPTMEKLRTNVAAGVPNAEEEFFASLISPIVEPADGDPTRKLVTFVFRGKDDTKTVTVLGGRPASEFDAPLENLPGSTSGTGQNACRTTHGSRTFSTSTFLWRSRIS
ncbi:MAG TPA: hypothetical protein VF432_19235 [Thermoanaerobaculia bacterium]